MKDEMDFVNPPRKLVGNYNLILQHAYDEQMAFVTEQLSITLRENLRLRAIEKAARDYYLGYVQDEADDWECCFEDAQHERAKALRDALGEK